MYEQDRTAVTITFRHPLVASEDQANQLLGYLGQDDLAYSVVQDVALVSHVDGVTTVTATIPASWSVDEFTEALFLGVRDGSRLAQGITNVTVTSTTPEEPTETITEGETATA